MCVSRCLKKSWLGLWINGFSLLLHYTTSDLGATCITFSYPNNFRFLNAFENEKYIGELITMGLLCRQCGQEIYAINTQQQSMYAYYNTKIRNFEN